MSELPKGWAEVTLGQITSKPQYGYTTKSQSSGSVRYLRTTDLTSGKVNWETVPYCVENPTDVSKYQLEDRDIVISRAGSVGFHSLISSPPEHVVFASYLIRFKPSIFVNERYLSRFLNSPAYWSQITEKAAGVAVQNVNAVKLADLRIPLAPLSEQKRIADKLDSILAKVDRAQQRLDKIPDILKRFRQAVLAAATSGELTREWREERPFIKRHEFSAYAIESYDSKPLPKLPSGWVFIPFEHVAYIRSNLVDPQLTPDAIHLAPNHIEQNTGKILEIATVANDGVTSSKHKFFSGQIVYSKIRPYLNKVALVDFDGVCSADMYPIEAKSNAKYLLYSMLSEKFVYWTSQQQGRVVLPKINQKALSKIPVAFPPEDEQIEIVRRVDELFSHANAVEKNFEAAKGWFSRVHQSVLAKAFRGELVTQDPNDEPASELLKRIKSSGVEIKPKRKTAPKSKVSATAKNEITKGVTTELPEQLDETFTSNLDAEKHEVIDRLRASHQTEIKKAQELLVDAKFSVEQFRSITDFKGGYDELKALIMNLLKGIPSVSEPIIAIESWDEKSGDYLMRLVTKK